jgi:hypothetical protein
MSLVIELSSNTDPYSIPVCLSLYLAICLSACLSLYLSICLSVCLFLLLPLGAYGILETLRVPSVS